MILASDETTPNRIVSAENGLYTALAIKIQYNCVQCLDYSAMI